MCIAQISCKADPECFSCAEWGVSEAKSARGSGHGTGLFERTVMHSRNERVSLLFVHAGSENTAMLQIARQAGAVIERGGSESEAHWWLASADFDSRVTEWVGVLHEAGRLRYPLHCTNTLIPFSGRILSQQWAAAQSAACR
jgi:hypothetical protein